MEVIIVFEEKGESKVFYLPSWYCKPAILEGLAYRLKKDFYPSLLFIACSKYGCRQFLPKFHKFFSVNNLEWRNYESLKDSIIIYYSV